MDNSVLKQEKSTFLRIRDLIKSAKGTLAKRFSDVGATNLEKLQDLRESGTFGLDFQMFIDQLDQSNQAFNFKDKFKKMEELEYLEKEPYFARVDLSDPAGIDEDHLLYIGKFGYTDEKPVITDWRAKIASVYYRYRYPQKNVQYETPEGIQTRDLLLKRTFEIDNGELIKFYNNDIQLDESEIIVDKIKHRTGGVLEDIVETIQISQMDIIEADPRQICIVQGCVGSGKSTVAIHKLAHIFFNYPNVIHPAKSILIAKNQILIGYLSTLFPKLGIFDIYYKTLRELAINLVFIEELGISVDLGEHTDTSDFTVDKLRAFREKISTYHKLVESKLNHLFSNPNYESFGGFKYSEKLTPYENLSELLNEIQEEIDMQKERLDVSPDGIRSMLYRENLKSLKKLAKEITNIRVKLKTTDFIEVLKTYELDKSKKLNYFETLIFILAYSELIGFLKFPKFEYCVIDEGQDVSLLEYAVLGKIVLRGRFAIFGDLNQSLEDDGVSRWENIKEVITEAKQASVFELTTNYRSTKQIIDVASRILTPYTDKHLPKSINRMGKEPVEEEFNSVDDLVVSFDKQVSEDIKDIDKSIGIICTNASLQNKVDSLLSKKSINPDQFIKLDSSKVIHYLPRGIYTMSMVDCKGLEFAKVYVLGMNLKKVKGAREARQAFVAVTRAMNELHVLGIK